MFFLQYAFSSMFSDFGAKFKWQRTVAAMSCVVAALPVATARGSSGWRYLTSGIGLLAAAGLLWLGVDQFKPGIDAGGSAMAIDVFYISVYSLFSALTLVCIFFTHFTSHCEMPSASADIFQYATSHASWRPPVRTLAEWRALTFESSSPDGQYSRWTNLWCLLRFFTAAPTAAAYIIPNVPLEVAPGVSSRPPLPHLIHAACGLSLGFNGVMHLIITVIMLILAEAIGFSLAVVISILGVLPIYVLTLVAIPLIAVRVQRGRRQGTLDKMTTLLADKNALSIVKGLSSTPIYRSLTYPASQAVATFFSLLLLVVVVLIVYILREYFASKYEKRYAF
jgi:hypothetical protein